MMDIYEASKIRISLGKAMMKEELFHDEDSIGYTKSAVVDAFKVWYIHMVKFNTLSCDEFSSDIACLMRIKDFIPHDDYLLVKDIEETSPIFDEMFDKYFCKSWDEYYEVMNFVDEIKTLNLDDSLYYQKAYTLGNLKYNPKYDQQFESVRYK